MTTVPLTWGLPLISPAKPFEMAFPTSDFEEALGDYGFDNLQSPIFDLFDGLSTPFSATFPRDSFLNEAPTDNDVSAGLANYEPLTSRSASDLGAAQESAPIDATNNGNSVPHAPFNTSIPSAIRETTSVASASTGTGDLVVPALPSGHFEESHGQLLKALTTYNNCASSVDRSEYPDAQNSNVDASGVIEGRAPVSSIEVSDHGDVQSKHIDVSALLEENNLVTLSSTIHRMMSTGGNEGQLHASEFNNRHLSADSSDMNFSNPQISRQPTGSTGTTNVDMRPQQTQIIQTASSPSINSSPDSRPERLPRAVAPGSDAEMARVTKPINDDISFVGQLPANVQLQQRSGTMGITAQPSTEVSSSTAPDSENGNTILLSSTDMPSAMSRQSSSQSRRHSSPSLYSPLHQRSVSPSAAYQRQQQQLRPSNLRHMSMPGQSGLLYQRSPAFESQALQKRQSSAQSPSLTRTMHPLGHHGLPNAMNANEAQWQYNQDLGNANCNGLLGMEHYLAELDAANLGLRNEAGQMNCFRGHSRGSDESSSQHSLANSPRINLGNRHIITQDLFQSPQQPNLQVDHPLAYQHFSNKFLHHSPNLSQQHAMKRETSSPESSSGAMERVKQAPSFEGRRINHTLRSNTGTADPHEQRCVHALFKAMMDMSQPQDNEGMIKTWRGLMKESDRIRGVCVSIYETCKRLENAGQPLQHTIKSQNTYESVQHRVTELCKAFQTQKTMCKHLMEPPYLFQVVDDPILAAQRVVNNRKVNKGKKQAIDAGRAALRTAHPHRAAEVNSVLGDNNEDDADGDDDEDYTQFTPYAMSPSTTRGATPIKRRNSSISRDSPAPKKTKRTSNSRYQVNEHGVMVDTGNSYKKARIPQELSRTLNGSRASVNRAQPTATNSFTGFDQDHGTDHNETDATQIYSVRGGLHGSGDFSSGFQGNHLGGYQGYN